MSKNNFLKILLDFVEMTFIGAAVFLLIYVFICQLLKVTGDSMFPTFLDGEQILSEKVSIITGELKRGQIVVFKHPLNPTRLLIKRVIAIPDDTILVADNKVTVNENVLDEKYLSDEIVTKGGRTIKEGVSFKVQENSYVLMGDNREKSSDSRDFGPVSKDLIVGKAFLVYFPLNRIKLISGL